MTGFVLPLSKRSGFPREFDIEALRVETVELLDEAGLRERIGQPDYAEALRKRADYLRRFLPANG